MDSDLLFFMGLQSLVVWAKAKGRSPAASEAAKLNEYFIVGYILLLMLNEILDRKGVEEQKCQ